jgi:hypothetical protein
MQPVTIVETYTLTLWGACWLFICVNRTKYLNTLCEEMYRFKMLQQHTTGFLTRVSCCLFMGHLFQFFSITDLDPSDAYIYNTKELFCHLNVYSILFLMYPSIY